MAPPITPSPHRFLASRGSSEPERKPITQTGRNQTDIVDQGDLRTPRLPLYHVSSPASTYRTSRFAVTPRFSTHRQVNSTKTAPPSSIRRDEVEDSERKISHPASAFSSSPFTRRARLHGGRERIDDVYQDIDHDAATFDPELAQEQAEEIYAPAPKRRKIPPPPTWGASNLSGSRAVDAGDIGMAGSRPAATDTTTPQRLRRSPIMISSSPNSKNQDRASISPGRTSSASPLSPTRKTPRFDFGRNSDATNRIANASEGLQRVAGTSQFILPPESGIDNHNSNLANTNLALLFSPQKNRRYQYAPGGMAATVRDWILDTAIGVPGNETISSLHVRSVKLGFKGSRLVVGTNKLEEKERYLVFGDPQGPSDAQIKVGDTIAIMEPSWTIELDNKPWTVIVKWKLAEKALR